MPVTPGINKTLGGAVIAACLTVLPPSAAHAALPADVTLPDTGVTVRESSADPLTVSSYTLGNLAYLRRGEAFAKQKGYQEITVAPGGTKALAVPSSYSSGHDSVLLADLVSEKAVKIQTVQKPFVAHFAHWSRDGRKVVLTVQRKAAGGWTTTGFVIVDVAAKTARTVTVSGVDPAATFRWTPDNAQLVAAHQGGVRFYGQDGTARRTLAKTGAPGGGEDVFSPSGKGLMTWCPASYAEDVCVWDRSSGKIAVKVKGVKPKALLGWWDERSFVAVLPGSGVYKVVVVDVKGKGLRVLADVSARDWNRKIYLSYTRS
ncbi:TolB family protein [Streptosporangium jomthongense]|uniref:TolB family protein n=1 Tax=Streptosporangium jomthongense TaxID=1193683 RepID=A0ABV8EZF3_9ACTN